MDINAQGGMNYELPPPMALHTGVRVDPAERRGARVEIGARLEAGAGAKHPDLLIYGQHGAVIHSFLCSMNGRRIQVVCYVAFIRRNPLQHPQTERGSAERLYSSM